MNSRWVTGIDRPRSRRARLAWLLTLALAGVQAVPARAEVNVTGDVKALVIEARDASVEEVMAALGSHFGLQYRGTATLERRISGSYRGTLQHVIRRVLDGYDFIMRTNVDDVEVTVLTGGKAGEARAAMTPSATTGVVPPPPPPTRAQSARERRQHRRQN